MRSELDQVIDVWLQLAVGQNHAKLHHTVAASVVLLGHLDQSSILAGVVKETVLLHEALASMVTCSLEIHLYVCLIWLVLDWHRLLEVDWSRLQI